MLDVLYLLVILYLLGIGTWKPEIGHMRRKSNEKKKDEEEDTEAESGSF